jgi:hypothetical protein
VKELPHSWVCGSGLEALIKSGKLWRQITSREEKIKHVNDTQTKKERKKKKKNKGRESESASAEKTKKKKEEEEEEEGGGAGKDQRREEEEEGDDAERSWRQAGIETERELGGKKKEEEEEGAEKESREKKKKKTQKSKPAETPRNSPKHPEILPKVEWGVVSYRFAYRYEIFRPFRPERNGIYNYVFISIFLKLLSWRTQLYSERIKIFYPIFYVSLYTSPITLSYLLDCVRFFFFYFKS